MNFWEIKAEAEKTRHLVYSYKNPDNPNAPELHAPAPKTVKASSGDELQQLRSTERAERAEQLAKLVALGSLEKCEELGVDIAGLIDPPEHVSMADADLAIPFQGLK